MDGLQGGAPRRRSWLPMSECKRSSLFGQTLWANAADGRQPGLIACYAGVAHLAPENQGSFKAFPMIPSGCRVGCHKFCHRAACNRVGSFSGRLRNTGLPEVNVCHPAASLTIDRLCGCGQFRGSVTNLESDGNRGWWKTADQANIERYLRLEQL